MDETIIYLKLLQKEKYKNTITIQKGMETPIKVLEVGLSITTEELLQARADRNTKIARKWKRLLEKEMKKNGCYFTVHGNDYLWLEPRVAETLGYCPQKYSIDYLTWIYGLQTKTDSLYIRSDEEGVFSEIIRELIKRIYENCNTLVIISNVELEKEMENLIDYIYQDFGLLVVVVEEIPQISPKRIINKKEQPPIFYDFSRNKINYRNLPMELTYIDLAPTKQKYRIVKEKRKDVSYTDYSDYVRIP